MGDVKRYKAWTVTDKDGNAALLDGRFIVLADDYDALLVRLAEVERERDRLRAVVHRFESHLLDGDGHLKAHWGCANNRNEPCNCPDFNRHPEPTKEPTE